MRSLLVGTCAVLALASPAEGKKKAPKAPAAKASAQTTRAIEELMGKYQWWMSRKQVSAAIEESVRAEFEEQIKETPEAIEQQKMRDEMMARIKEFQGSYFEFTGRKSGWDVSLIDTEFAHKNNESMLVVWERDQRRFFFFHHGQLYKMFVALAADKFKGKTFEDFGQLIQDRYGSAEARYTPNRAGTPVFDRLVWPSSGNTQLQAVDRSFYGNFCLNMLDTRETERVGQGREINSPKAQGGDPEVEAALRESGVRQDPNEDVVDQITKRHQKGPQAGSGDEGMVDPAAPPKPAEPAAPAKKDEGKAKKEETKPAAEPEKKKKKISSDPLDNF